VAASAVIDALNRVWAALEPLNLPMALMGGLAVAVWKHPRNTRDVDILVDVRGGSLDELVEAMQRAGMRSKRQPPVLRVGDQRMMQLLYPAPGTFLDIQIDVLLADSAYQKQALTRAKPAKLDGEYEIAVLSCEDLIIHKLLAGRIIDSADVAALLRANRAGLDQAYLKCWLGQLNLLSQLETIWHDTFPTESPGE
jgi:nucleotidyltransferase AbiEii toxin of type IV toxin-antitoxin system